ncbi:MAG: nucleoside monophosphate kinase [bacterium]
MKESLNNTTGKPLNFVLIGRSGCGKGTQAKLLTDFFKNMRIISSGGLLRKLAKKKTAVGKKIKKILVSGGLPSNDIAVTLWMYEMCQRLEDNEGLIADGFPRRLKEAISLARFLEFLGRVENTYCVLLDISKEEAFGRLSKRRVCKKCGKLIPWIGKFRELEHCDSCGGDLLTRPDDEPKAIKSRLAYYERWVVPAIRYFEKKKMLIRVNGDQPIDKVFSDIIGAVSSRVK